MCRFLSIVLLFVLMGCSSNPKPHTTTKINSISSYQHITLPTLQKSSSSYFYPLGDPRDALFARLYLIDHATKNIDVQYYIYENDSVGKIFTYHLLQAANRGVKVRLLLDDLDVSGKDESWQLLTQHPNITLKLFNPIHFRKTLRYVALVLHLDRLSKRMHNKSLIVDKKFAIIGGRNIGDVYYATTPSKLFLDFDLFVAGKVVHDISKMFKEYYTSPLSVDSNVLFHEKIDPTKLSQKQEEFASKIATLQNGPYRALIESAPMLQKLQNRTFAFIKADAKLFWDAPRKITTSPEDPKYHLSKEIAREFEHIQKSIIIISPYFIPTKKLLKRFKELRKKGVKITIITNSLASNDVAIVYSAYQNYIRELLFMGIKLYEIKPTSFLKRVKSYERVALHTKLMIFDNRYVGVGSANLDPRSIKLNTELFMLIDSKELVSNLQENLKKILTSDDVLELEWGEIPTPYTLKDIKTYGVIYKTTENKKEVRYYAPPYSGFFKKLGVNILSYFPIEGYL